MAYIDIKGKRVFFDEIDKDRVMKFKWVINGGYVRAHHICTGLYWMLATDKLPSTKRDKYVRIVIHMHRMIMNLASDDPREVDHINHNPLDNRRKNLRIVTRRQNLMNMVAFKGVSKYKCVTKTRHGTYLVSLNHPDKRTTKTLKNEIDAALYYDAFAKYYYGEYAWLNSDNFPELQNTKCPTLDIKHRTKKC